MGILNLGKSGHIMKLPCFSYSGILCTSMKEGSVPCPGQPELAYKGETFSSRDRFRPC